ncbi:CLUMA_CG011403, isoform A [Clunio marinus]|uniref:CLUMA_CG011403, isoform A n=1 Tax=Clunio marinus TaxID=568069 RepID=A0A1J1IE37_9DIPT|nr:CLUMA_CG011403, isoform A [Clunio marinus]
MILIGSHLMFYFKYQILGTFQISVYGRESFPWFCINFRLLFIKENVLMRINKDVNLECHIKTVSHVKYVTEVLRCHESERSRASEKLFQLAKAKLRARYKIEALFNPFSLFSKHHIASFYEFLNDEGES